MPEIQWIADKPNEHHRSAREQHLVRPHLLSRQNHKNRAQRWHYRPDTWETCGRVEPGHRQEQEQEPRHRQQVRGHSERYPATVTLGYFEHRDWKLRPPAGAFFDATGIRRRLAAICSGMPRQ